jgi:hypothetical protein
MESGGDRPTRKDLAGETPYERAEKKLHEEFSARVREGRPMSIEELGSKTLEAQKLWNQTDQERSSKRSFEQWKSLRKRSGSVG